MTVIGAVFAGTRLEGVLSDRVRRDGANATTVLARLVDGCRFRPQLQALLLQGIALAGFNVVDIHRLNERTGLPVLVVARRPPDLRAIHDALFARVPGAARKWRLIQRAGPMEPAGRVWVQRAGLDLARAEALVQALAVNSDVPEPLRTAHLIAGGIARGESRRRV